MEPTPTLMFNLVADIERSLETIKREYPHVYESGYDLSDRPQVEDAGRRPKGTVSDPTAALALNGISNRKALRSAFLAIDKASRLLHSAAGGLNGVIKRQDADYFPHPNEEELADDWQPAESR